MRTRYLSLSGLLLGEECLNPIQLLTSPHRSPPAISPRTSGINPPAQNLRAPPARRSSPPPLFDLPTGNVTLRFCPRYPPGRLPSPTPVFPCVPRGLPTLGKTRAALRDDPLWAEILKTLLQLRSRGHPHGRAFSGREASAPPR